MGVFDVLVNDLNLVFLFEVREHIEFFIGAQDEVNAWYLTNFFRFELCITAQNNDHRFGSYLFGAFDELLAFFVGVFCYRTSINDKNIGIVFKFDLCKATIFKKTRNG